MTTPMAADVTVVAPPGVDHHSHVDWAAIIAGIVMASAISILFLTFGSAVGLSFANFQAREGADPIWIAVIAASWFLWVEVSSFMIGAYVTGRMRRRAYDSNAHEVDVRDGTHGLLVWAGALVFGALLAAQGVGAIANVVGSAAATVTDAASNVAGGAAQGIADAVDPNAYVLDTLFRAPAPGGDTAATTPAAAATPAATDTTTTAAAPAATTTPTTDTAATTTTTPAATTPATTSAATPAAAGTPSSEAAAPVDNTATLAEAGRIFAANTTNGEFKADDRDYLVQMVAQRTGISTEEAQARVDQAVTAVEKARDDAAKAAETARRTGVIAGFLIAASLLVSAIGAFWAAQKGGQHRDEGTVFADVFRRW